MTKDQRILKAMQMGRLVYNTGKKTKSGSNIWETLSPTSRDLFGLPPLEEVITDKRIIKNFAESGYFKRTKEATA